MKVNLQTAADHLAFFRQISDYFRDCYGVSAAELDASGKNVDRLCFLPYDPDAYYNADSDLMPLAEEYQINTTSPKQAKNKLVVTDQRAPAGGNANEDTTQRLTDCIEQLKSQGIDLTTPYEEWIKIGFSLASLGEEGRRFFHDVSSLNAGYEWQSCDAKFSELLRNRNGKNDIATFFFLCKEALGSTFLRGTTEQKKQSTAVLSQEWKEPQPISTTLLSVLSVSHPMLPERLRPWLIDIANRMKCPLDFVASAAVVMLSSLIGTRLCIKPKFRDDWTITPNLWGASIGDPSTMKTPSIAEVFKPLNRLTTESRKQYEEAMQSYEAEQLTFEAQKNVYSSQEKDRLKGKAVANPVDFPEPAKKPTERRYMTNDATVEKLADLLNENPTGVLQFRDELTGLLAGWERSGREEDRAFYLEAWNGSGSKTVDRIGRGTIHIKNLCVSLYGGIQPVKLLSYLQAATDYDNDGFVQRLQVAVFPDRPKWEYIDEYPDKRARDTAFTLIQKIVKADLSGIGYDADDYNQYPFTRFDADAQEIFKQWLIEWETDVLPREGGLLLEHFTKYRSLMPSLALIFHIVNCVDVPPPLDCTQKILVSAEAAQMAVAWCTYLQSHARRIYNLLDTQPIEAAKALLLHLKKGDLKDGFKARDVLRKGWANLLTLDRVESALAELITNGWLMEIQPPPTATGRPESPHYLVHPKLTSNV